MKTKASLLGYKITEQPSELGEIHISNEAIENARKKLGSISLKDMIFQISLPDKIWEISAPVPNGTGEAIASVIPSVMGKLDEQDNGIIVCTSYN
jgi:hypothetical protein